MAIILNRAGADPGACYIFKNKTMHELFVMIAKMMPEEALIEEIEKALLEYKITRSVEAKRKLGSFVWPLQLRKVQRENQWSRFALR